MMIRFPSTPVLEGGERYLDLTARKQALVAANLANIDTPGYRTMDFSVELAMQQSRRREPGLVLNRPHPRHLPGGTPAGWPSPVGEAVDGLPRRNDGNDVDLDREMLQLSRTAAKFGIAAQILRAEFRKLQHAITEGR